MTILGMEYDANVFIKFKDSKDYYEAINGVGINDSEGKFHTLQEIADVFMDLKNADMIFEPIGQIFESVTAVGSKAFYYIHYRNRNYDAVMQLTPFIVDLIKKAIPNSFMVISNITSYDDDSVGDHITISFPNADKLREFDIEGPEGLDRHINISISDYMGICEPFYDQLSEEEKNYLKQYSTDARNLMDNLQFMNTDKEYKQMVKKWDEEKALEDDNDLVEKMGEDVKREVDEYINKTDDKIFSIYKQFENSKTDYKNERKLAEIDAEEYTNILVKRAKNGEHIGDIEDLVGEFLSKNVHAINFGKLGEKLVYMFQDMNNEFLDCQNRYKDFRVKGLNSRFKEKLKDLLGRESALHNYVFEGLKEIAGDSLNRMVVDHKGFLKVNHINQDKDYLEDVKQYDNKVSFYQLNNQLLDEVNDSLEISDSQQRKQYTEEEINTFKEDKARVEETITQKINQLTERIDSEFDRIWPEEALNDVEEEKKKCIEEYKKELEGYYKRRFSVPVFDSEYTLLTFREPDGFCEPIPGADINIYLKKYERTIKEKKEKELFEKISRLNKEKEDFERSAKNKISWFEKEIDSAVNDVGSEVFRKEMIETKEKLLSEYSKKVNKVVNDRFSIPVYIRKKIDSKELEEYEDLYNLINNNGRMTTEMIFEVYKEDKSKTEKMLEEMIQKGYLSTVMVNGYKNIEITEQAFDKDEFNNNPRERVLAAYEEDKSAKKSFPDFPDVREIVNDKKYEMQKTLYDQGEKIRNKIQSLRDEYNSLGLFATKQKNAIQIKLSQLEQIYDFFTLDIHTNNFDKATAALEKAKPYL